MASISTFRAAENCGAGAPRSDHREFCEVVDWDAYQYSDTRKKPRPPWKWFRVQMTLLRSPDWLALTKPMRADFIAVLGAASETGNLIPLDKRWLGARQLSANSIQKLSKFGLTRVFSLAPDSHRIRDLRSTYSGTSPPPEGEAETESDSDSDVLESTQPCASPTNLVHSSTANGMDSENPVPSLSPASSSRRRRSESVGELLTRKNRHDKRPFDEIKSGVLEMALRFETNEPDQIHMYAGRSRKWSLKQVTAAVNQLKQDGKL